MGRGSLRGTRKEVPQPGAGRGPARLPTACTSGPRPQARHGLTLTVQTNSCREHTACVALNHEEASFTEATTPPGTVQCALGGNDSRPAPTASQVLAV